MSSELEYLDEPAQQGADDLEKQDEPAEPAQAGQPDYSFAPAGTNSKTASSSWPARALTALNIVLGMAIVASAIAGLVLGVSKDDNNDADKAAVQAPDVAAEDGDAVALLECPTQGTFSVPTGNDENIVSLNRIINQEDETVTVQLVYEGNGGGWMGFAFSESPAMVPNVAVIGLPDEGTVLKYNLGGKDVSAVTLLEEDRQSLTDTIISQNETHTVLMFTKPLLEEGEPDVTVGDNLFLWAVGGSNVLGYHGPEGNRGSASAAFDDCGGEVVDNTPPAVVELLECPTQGTFSVPTGNDENIVSLNRIINQEDETVTVQLVYEGNGGGWMGFAFSESPAMVPNVAVIGLPDEGTVLKYNLGGKDVSAVTSLEEDRQSLTDTIISQNETHTVLMFTKPLLEQGEPDVSVGDNLFLWAVGGSNVLGYHGPEGNRGSASAAFDGCGGEVVDTPAPLTAAPTASPTSAPVTNSPTPGVVIPAPPPTNAPVAGGDMAGTFSKRGNRQSCSIDWCPSDGFDAQVSGDGCTCDNGLNSCVWNGQPTTVESFEEVELIPTNVNNIWLIRKSGNQLNLGEGGDDASGVDCFDDPLRGGFRLDLTNSQFQITIQSTVTVTGFSPAMRVVADGVNVGEVRQYGAQASLDVEIPPGTRDLQVACGGWPADCTSTIYVAPW